MSAPTPVQSFLGGVGLALPVHALLLLNGNVFGISGFVHRAALGIKEPAFAVMGLVLGGAYIGLLEGHGPSPFHFSIGRVALSGLLVGLGSKLSNGCTSGHMICGLSRLSLRSFVATLTFFVTGVVTAQLLPSELPSVGPMDWSLGPNGKVLLVTQAVTSALLATLAYTNNRSSNTSTQAEPLSTSRLLAFLATGFEFALALRFSNLSESTRVLSFLGLPFRSSFDPSLAFLAAGALPLSIALYRFFRGSGIPLLGGIWSIPQGAPIDMKLIGGAAVFGVGWGLAGICRKLFDFNNNGIYSLSLLAGPGLVNLGRAISGGSGVFPVATWLAGVVIGGLFV
ncbi:hypothetical protein H0H93_011883 [Arthromyces matolae]|nr:hypothetical protein H0H93_011883 [Arthromyces matolae]